MSDKLPSIERTTTERITIELQKDELELAIALWLMDNTEAFRGVEFKFDWYCNDSLPYVTVVGHRSIGERIAP